MPKRMIVPQPPPRPTPLVGALTPMSRAAAHEAVNAMRAIPGVEAAIMGNLLRVRITGNSFMDVAQKILALPETLSKWPSKTMCDGEPVRIT